MVVQAVYSSSLASITSMIICLLRNEKAVHHHVSAFDPHIKKDGLVFSWFLQLLTYPHPPHFSTAPASNAHIRILGTINCQYQEVSGSQRFQMGQGSPLTAAKPVWNRIGYLISFPLDKVVLVDLLIIVAHQDKINISGRGRSTSPSYQHPHSIMASRSKDGWCSCVTYIRIGCS